MATCTWVGTSSGNEGDVSVAANWSPAALPTDGDTVLIGPGGNQDMTSGLAALAAITPAKLDVYGYSGAIGDSANDLQWAGCTEVLINCTGELRLDFGVSTAAPTGRITGTSTSINQVFLKGNWTRLIVDKGLVTVSSGTVTELDIQYTTTTSDATVALLTPTVTNLYALAGTLTMASAGTITNLFTRTGHTATLTAGTLTNVQLWGGTVNWQTTETLVSALLFAGLLDGSGDPRAREITTLTMRGASECDLRNGHQNITVGTENVYGLYQPKRWS